ncbi:hypothetical protein AB0G02_27805 [Actinosynnema sp. NPDC023658]|uniref:hypothetical protein n=1 Tax=Actinosynnema sp. NPDC023658 TaxID=3155465 RepID=UPI0033E7327D
MEQYDVDKYNILPSPSSPPDYLRSEPIPQILDAPAPADVTSDSLVRIDGNGNDTALRDVIKPVMTIETAVFGDQFAELARPRKRTGRGLQDHSALARLASRYVPPSRLLTTSTPGEPDSALSVLLRDQVLLLTAKERRGGQFAASLRLGYELQKSRRELVVREELIDRLGDDDLLVEDEPAVVVVDLRTAPHDELQAVRRDLVELCKQFVSHQSYLILIIPVAHKREFEEFLPGRVHDLECPKPVDVLAKYLGTPATDPVLNSSEFADDLRDLWPPTIKEVADAVSDRGNRGEEREQALREVLRDRQGDPGPPLREVVRKKQGKSEVEWLALLLAAALLEGAAPWHVVAAADSLLVLNKVERKKTVPLLTPSPYTRLSDLDYGSFTPENCRFQASDSGAEVFRYFWQEHRDLRKTMVEWMGALPGQISDLTRDELERFADRCAELAGCGGTKEVLELAEIWARPSAESDDGVSDHWKIRYRRSIAVRLLTTTATDPAAGARIRQKLLDWSKKGENLNLQLLTAEVCAGIGEAFPRIALTRLKYLADSPNPDVWSATRQATVSIGADLGTASFLRHVAEWSENAGSARLRLMVESTATVLARDSEDADLAAVVEFWRQALRTMPLENLYPAIVSWLRTAAETPDTRWDHMMAPLVLATDAELKPIGQVRHAGRSAAGYGHATGSGRLIAIVERLSSQLDEIDPLVPK